MANTDLDILILAAGLGTRMRSDLAKVLHRLDGRPLINHVLDAAVSLSPKKIYTVIGHQGEDVKKAVLNDLDGSIAEFAWQQQMLGTGDAVNAAREMLENEDSTLLVLSGDVPMIRPETLEELVRLHNDHHGRRAACTVLTVKLQDPTGYGRVIRDELGTFDRIVEQKDGSPDELAVNEINSGIYCFDTKKLFAALKQVGNQNAQGEYYLTDVPRILCAAGEDIAIYLHDDPTEIEGVNDRRQLAAMEKTTRAATVRHLMLESGVTFVDPNAAYVSKQAVIGRDTVVYQNVTIEGKTVIGEGCTIRPGVRIADSVIGNGVEVRDNSFITDSHIGEGCTVGPMAHLRGHAVMEPGSKVGNFVELKKTRLGKGSKASHLTYLGDATIGENTNIGAGTITCNYDGKNKHETHIGDNVKIGSDTMLVAPVTVGDGSITGAGSVVTMDVDPNKLVVGAPARAIKSLDKEKSK
ncbi:MAG: bifunctional UDP-N-acetylglucosamine diphosphorylase/glucosamine-1-phosphate N-acetyltransferase GlmU [Pyrinomonadaceae bacterium]|nr:bifunctional UDP-N-acetylglucosamine diphosphorylase/glucosamine-1-phosphate N-acetyltransferase GlmU [Pyrinomonadaceae bacterium]MBP6211693.1 bifunctional UDP-N-acetylglucosamine diphosphorylase/glucosamine-1-phosphate N-acetyltransferase GlmU [Pyrinomonadaceae bacterium]